MKNQTRVVVAALTVSVALLSGCGSNDTPPPTGAASSSAAGNEQTAPQENEPAVEEGQDPAKWAQGMCDTIKRDADKFHLEDSLRLEPTEEDQARIIGLLSERSQARASLSARLKDPIAGLPAATEMFTEYGDWLSWKAEWDQSAMRELSGMAPQEAVEFWNTVGFELNSLFDLEASHALVSRPLPEVWGVGEEGNEDPDRAQDAAQMVPLFEEDAECRDLFDQVLI